MLEDLYYRCNTRSILSDETKVQCELPRHLAIKVAPKSWHLSRLVPSLKDSSDTFCTVRLSLWRSATERLSEDSYINLDSEEDDLIFNLSRYYVSDLRELYLYVDLYHLKYGVPLAIGSVKVSLVEQKNENTDNSSSPDGQVKNDSIDLSAVGVMKQVSIILRSNPVIRGFKDIFNRINKSNTAPITVEIHVGVQSTITTITYKDIKEISIGESRPSKLSCNLLRPYPQRMLDAMQEFYLPVDRLHLVVEDLQLNKDLLDFYSNRPIIVRIAGVTDLQAGGNLSDGSHTYFTPMLYLGSISNLQGVWLECNELTTMTSCEAIDVEIVVLVAIPASFATGTSKDTTIPNDDTIEFHIEESLICKGRISLEHHITAKQKKKQPPQRFAPSSNSLGNSAANPNHILISGVYESFLQTEIQSVRGNNSGNHNNAVSKVQVGKIRLRIKCDDLQDLSREHLQLCQLDSIADDCTAPSGSISLNHSRPHPLRDQQQWQNNHKLEIKKFKTFLESDEVAKGDANLDKIFTLVSSCCSLIRTSHTASNQVKLESLIQYIDLAFGKVDLTDDSVFDLLALQSIQQNAEENLLCGFQFYFQEWLSSDIVQQLLQISREMLMSTSRFNSYSIAQFLEEESQRVNSIQKALVCLTWNHRLQYFMPQSSNTSEGVHQTQTQQQHPEDDRPSVGQLTAVYVGEICEDLFTVVCNYRRQLLLHALHELLDDKSDDLQERETIDLLVWFHQTICLSLFIQRYFETFSKMMIQAYIDLQKISFYVIKHVLEKIIPFLNIGDCSSDCNEDNIHGEKLISLIQRWIFSIVYETMMIMRKVNAVTISAKELRSHNRSLHPSIEAMNDMIPFINSLLEVIDLVQIVTLKYSKVFPKIIQEHWNIIHSMEGFSSLLIRAYGKHFVFPLKSKFASFYDNDGGSEKDIGGIRIAGNVPVNEDNDDHALVDICDKLTEVSRRADVDVDIPGNARTYFAGATSSLGEPNPLLPGSKEYHPKQNPRKKFFSSTFEDAMSVELGAGTNNNAVSKSRGRATTGGGGKDPTTGFGTINILVANNANQEEDPYATPSPYPQKFTFTPSGSPRPGVDNSKQQSEVMRLLSSNIANSNTTHNNGNNFPFMETKRSEDEEANAIGLTTLLFIKHSSLILSLLYDLVVFMLRAQDCMESMAVKSNLIDVKAIVLLSKELVYCMMENIANSKDWDPKTIKKLFTGYFYGPDSMKFSKDMKDGLMIFAVFSSHVDELYFAYLQSLLDENVTKNLCGPAVKEKGGGAKKKDYTTFSTIATEESARSLLYYHGLASIIYDLNKIRVQVNSTQKEPLALSNEFKLPDEGKAFTDEIHRETFFIRCYKATVMKRLPLRNAEIFGSVQLRLDLLETLKKCFQFYWNAFQYNSFILFQKENVWKEQLLAARNAVNVNKRSKVEDLVETRRQKLQQLVHSYLSSLEATVSIIHTVVGVDYLLKGERNLSHASSSFSLLADDMFNLSYLRFALKIGMDVLSLSYVTPVGLTAGGGVTSSVGVSSSSAASASAAAMAEYRSAMDQFEDYLFDDRSIYNIPLSSLTPASIQSTAMTTVVNDTDVGGRLSVLRIQIICMILEIVLMIPVNYPVSPTDLRNNGGRMEKDLTIHNNHSNKSWKHFRNVQLFQQFQSFLFTISNHVIQEHNQLIQQSSVGTSGTTLNKQNQGFLWKVPLILNAEYSPFMLKQDGVSYANMSDQQGQFVSVEGVTKEFNRGDGFKVDLDLLLCDILQMIMTIHHQNNSFNKVNEITKMYTTLLTSIKSLSMYCQFQPVMLANKEKLEKGTGKGNNASSVILDRHGMDKLFVHSALTSLFHTALRTLSVDPETSAGVANTGSGDKCVPATMINTTMSLSPLSTTFGPGASATSSSTSLSRIQIIYQELKRMVEDSDKETKFSPPPQEQTDDGGNPIRRQNGNHNAGVSNKKNQSDEGLEPSQDEDYWVKYIGTSHHAFNALAIFLLDYHQNHGCSKDISELQDRQKEKEVHQLRVCLSQLMNSGYWEIGLQVATWYQRNHADAIQAIQNANKYGNDIAGMSTLSPLASPNRSTVGPITPQQTLLLQHQRSTSSYNGVNAMLKFETPFSMGTLSPKRTRSPMRSPHPLVTPGGANSLSMSMTGPGLLASSMAITSPTKRFDTINSELSRIISKFKEKLKFDGNVRLPTRYYAIRFISNAPLMVNPANMASSSNAASSGPISIVKVHSINITNLTGSDGFNIKSSSSNNPSNTVWYEQWCIIRFDFSSSLACAEYYQLYLEEFQLLIKQQKNKNMSSNSSTGNFYPLTGDLPDLSSPLAFHVLCRQIKASFPEYIMMSAGQDINQLTDFSSLFRDKFSQVYADKASGWTSSNVKKYIQLYPVYTRQICDQVFESEHFLRVKRADPIYGEEEQSEGGSDNEGGGDDENDVISDLDTVLKMKPLNVLLDNGNTGNDGNVFNYKKLQRDLDCKFIHFEEFPTDFYAFAPMRCDGDRGIAKIHLSIDEVKLPVTLILTGEDGSTYQKDDKVLNITSLGMSPMTNAVHIKTERVNVIESCLEVMLHNAVYLDRMFRSMHHLNELKATELANQPDHSILHSDCLFYHCFDLLSSMLAQPAVACVGIHNVDFILLSEKDKIDVKWQTVRKHAKREYMRQVSQYEEMMEARANGLHSGIQGSEPHILGGSRKYGEKHDHPQKPQEPDLDELKEKFDKEAGLELLEYLQIVRNHVLKKIVFIIKEMKKFADKISAPAKAPTVNVVTQDDARGFARAKGRLSVTMMANLRINQWAQQLDSAVEKVAGPSNEEDIPVDDDLTLKQKLCLYLESQFAAIEVGVSL